MHVPSAGAGQDAGPQPASGQISLKRQVTGQRPNEEVSGASAKGMYHSSIEFFHHIITIYTNLIALIYHLVYNNSPPHPF